MKTFIKTLWHFSYPALLRWTGILFGSLLVALFVMAPIFIGGAFIVGSIFLFIIVTAFNLSVEVSITSAVAIGIAVSMLLLGINELICYLRKEIPWHWEQAKRKALKMN